MYSFFYIKGEGVEGRFDLKRWNGFLLDTEMIGLLTFYRILRLT